MDLINASGTLSEKMYITNRLQRTVHYVRIYKKKH